MSNEEHAKPTNHTIIHEMIRQVDKIENDIQSRNSKHFTMTTNDEMNSDK